MEVDYWIIGMLYSKNRGPNSKDEKVIRLLTLCETDRQKLLLTGAIYANKRNLLGQKKFNEKKAF